MQNVLARKGVVVVIILLFVGTSVMPCLKSDSETKAISNQNNAPTTDWWPMFHHDLSHSGYSTSTAPNTNNTLWSYTTGGDIAGSAAIVDDKVYFGSGDGNVYCLDANTGTKIWSLTLGDAVWSSPAVVNGKVYIGSNDKKVYCLNADNGEWIWSFNTSSYGGIGLSSPAVVNGKVYIGTYIGDFFCLNAENGTEIWKTGSNLVGWWGSPAVVNGLVYVGKMGGEYERMWCFNADTGSAVWSYPVFGGVLSSPAVINGKIYFCGRHNNTFCLDAYTGEKIWNFTTGEGATSSPAVTNGKVYFSGGWDYNVYCLNADTGVKIWNFTTEWPIASSSPAVADGKVYIGSDGDKKIYCLDANTGTNIWNYTIDFIESSPAVADGKVYIGSDDSNKMDCFGSIGNLPPIAYYNWAPTNPGPGQTITFDASASYDPDGSIILYEWDWNNDGTYEEYHTNPSATISWSQPGNYPVRMRVTDNQGKTGKIIQTITVGDFPCDLTVQNIVYPDYILVGHTYDIHAKAVNIGGKTAQNSFDMKFYVKGPSDHDWNLLGTFTIPPLAPGASVVKGVSWVPIEPSIHFIKVMVDTTNTVPEGNESNNENTSYCTVMPTVEIEPAKYYYISTQKLDIDARVHDLIWNRDITSQWPGAVVTWKLYDQNGSQIPGYGGSGDPFTFNSDPSIYCWQNHENNLSALPMGKKYTVKILYCNGTATTSMDFFKASGKTWIKGYVYDKKGNPLNGATVKLYKVLKLKYTTTTDQNGHYAFDSISMGAYTIKVNYTGLKKESTTGIFSSDRRYVRNFTLWDHTVEQYKYIVFGLWDACHNAKASETSQLESIISGVDSFDDKDAFWDVADLAASVMTVDPKTVEGVLFENGVKEIGTKAPIEILEKAALRDYPITVAEYLDEKIPDIILSPLLESITKNLNRNLESSTFYIEIGNGIDNYYNDYVANAPTNISPYLSIDRAHALIDSLSQQLDDLDTTMFIPFDYQYPIYFLFPSSASGFWDAYHAREEAENAEHACVIIQIIIGAVSIGLAIFTGCTSLALLKVAQAVGYIGTAASIAGLFAQSIAYLDFGASAGNWIKDLKQLPSVMFTAENWFRKEGNGSQVKYLDDRKEFNCEITDYEFPADHMYHKTPVVIVPTQGGLVDKPAIIKVKNTNDNPVDLCAKIYPCLSRTTGSDNVDWQYTTDLPSGSTWAVDEGAVQDGQYQFCVSAYNTMEMYQPRTFQVEVSAGLPTLFPPQIQSTTYFTFPFMYKTKDMDEVVPLSTKSGRLRFIDALSYYPNETVVYDGVLTNDNPIVDCNYTVSNSSQTVDFALSSSGPFIDYAVYNSQGHRIGYNITTGFVDTEFIGRCLNGGGATQTISISNATGRTYRIHLELVGEYLENQSHRVTVRAIETSERPAMLAVDSDEQIVPAATDSIVTIPINVAEAGLFSSLQNVTVTISKVQKNGEVLPLLSNDTFNIGIILPGNATAAWFEFEIPKGMTPGNYTGIVTVNASNAEAIPIQITLRVSNAPKKPVITQSSEVGLRNTSYTFKAQTTDPDNDNVSYMWDWGDGHTSDWLGPYNSGGTISASHSWDAFGVYGVSVKAKDSSGVESPWSDSFTINIINASKLKRSWLIGVITNVNTGADLTCFNASFLFSIRFGPFSFVPYFSGEKLVVSNQYLGRIGPHFILGRFDCMILYGSTNAQGSLRDRLKYLIATSPKISR
jgi:outer membrane protein assembly factor BamB/protocatechuate 3,4-dioxygenase beta subunit